MGYVGEVSHESELAQTGQTIVSRLRRGGQAYAWLFLDNTAPTNAVSLTVSPAIASDTWQNSVSTLVTATLQGAGDPGGSGLAGFNTYWGSDSGGACTNPVTGTCQRSGPRAQRHAVLLAGPGVDVAGNRLGVREPLHPQVRQRASGPGADYVRGAEVAGGSRIADWGLVRIETRRGGVLASCRGEVASPGAWVKGGRGWVSASRQGS